MRRLRAAVVLAAALLSGGCFQLSTVLTVRGDGSGTIQQRLVFSQTALSQLRQLAAFAGNAQGADPISEDAARAGADLLGQGVTYVSSTPITTPEGEGRDITYAFTSIERVHVVVAPPLPGNASVMAQGLSSSSDLVSFHLTRQSDGRVLLQIVTPEPALIAGARATAGQPRAAGGIPNGQLAMLRPLLGGARLTIAVEPAGQIIRTNSPYVDGGRVTLIDIPVDQLFNDDTLLPRLQAATTADQARLILNDVPAVKVTLDHEVTIEFTPAR